jgi:hypothetical protein
MTQKWRGVRIGHPVDQVYDARQVIDIDAVLINVNWQKEKRADASAVR